MSDLGQMLKQARLERGITLEQLQETTKIRIRYLQAIEEENFSVLPGNFYARAFIKSYAEAVGLDPDEVMRLYQHVIPPSHSDVSAETIRPTTRTRRRTNSDRIARWAMSLLVLSFFILIFVVIYHFVLSNDKENDQHLADETPIVRDAEELTDDENGEPGFPPEDQPAAPDPQPEPEPVPEPEPEPELTFAATDGSTHVYTMTNAESLKLELRFPNGRCWIQVKEGSDSGREIIQKTYNQGESGTWEVANSLYVRLGNPRAAEVRLNGIQIDPAKLLVDNPVNFQFNLVKPDGEGQQ